MEQVSQRIPLIDAAEKLTGRLRFAADMTLPGLLHGAFLFSPRAHARIVEVDPAGALAVSGVIGIWWHANTPQNSYNSSIWFAGQKALADERMFPPVVRHMGDRVAVVLAETEAIARAAVTRIVVSFEDLPAILTPEATVAHAVAAAGVEEAIYPNTVEQVHFTHGDPDAAFARADHVTEAVVHTPRSHHCAIEPHVCVAWPEPGGRVAIHSPCQSVHAV